MTPEEIATDLVETIAKRARSGGIFDFNLAYAACLESLLAYGNERAAAEVERIRLAEEARLRRLYLLWRGDIQPGK